MQKINESWQCYMKTSYHAQPLFLLFFLSPSIPLDWLLGQKPACDLMQLWRADCSTGFQASSVLLATATYWLRY